MSERVLVCGDRNWKDRELIHDVLSELPKGSVVIHGAAKGADTLAGEVAKELEFEVVEFPAMWDKYGKRAGPMRNAEMIKYGVPNRVIAFHPDIEKSKGTKDMVTRSRIAKLPVEIVEGWDDD